jgi:hypothetical protein
MTRVSSEKAAEVGSRLSGRKLAIPYAPRDVLVSRLQCLPRPSPGIGIGLGGYLLKKQGRVCFHLTISFIIAVSPHLRNRTLQRGLMRGEDKQHLASLYPIVTCSSRSLGTKGSSAQLSQ